ncbi:MAG: DUF4130 domain-containing protein [Clostridiales bacterium]|nr:DUF4130 domain-containing protein [Clostridiales bacterium]
MNGMINEFSYDGTIEGFLTVMKHCIDSKVMPRRIKPEYKVTGSSDHGRFMYIRSDYEAADKLYKMVGRRSSAEVQQMVVDFFLTAVPDMEMDLFIMICKAIKYGAVIAEDYQDELMRRVQFAIRDMYREAASVLHGMSAVTIDGVSFSVINPRNNVLPVIFKTILRNEAYGDILVYDKRHTLVLIRMNETDVILDTGRFQNNELNSPYDLYSKMWTYFKSEDNTISHQVRKEKADALSKLWYIAV